MIQSLAFTNFKAWAQFGPQRLAPITLFFGTNSAGKTSVGQLLLLLKQSAASKDPKLALNFGDARSDVDLGTLDESLHRCRHASNEKEGAKLAFDLRWARKTGDVVNRLGRDKLEYDAVSFHAELQRGKQGQAEVQGMGYAFLKEGQEVEFLAMQREEGGGEAYALQSRPHSPQLRLGREGVLPKPGLFFKFPPETDAFFVGTEHSKQLEFELTRLLEGLHHLGPLREPPRRQYLWGGQAPESVGPTGAQAIEAFLGAQERHFSFPGQSEAVSMAELVAGQLKRMGLIEGFRVAPIAAGRKEHEVLVQSRKGLPEVKLTDVGFGVSQALPVVVNAFCVPPQSVLLLEQPEIHLHPKAQAELADLFIDGIQAMEQGQARGLQFVIESHSEHLLRRLQRRLAEGKIQPSDLALYFVHHDGAQAKLEAIEVDEGGNILNWPDAFFGDPMEDLVAQAQANAVRARGGKA